MKCVFALRAAVSTALLATLTACASSHGPGQAAVTPPPPPPAQGYQSVPPQQVYRPAPPQQAYRPVPPQQSYQPAPPQQAYQSPAAQAPHSAVVAGAAFPADGSGGKVPQGSKLTVRVYDAAGGDVNKRVAEKAFDASRGLPVPYEVPVAAQALGQMQMPAVAARVTGPGGRVIYRNEIAVLLRDGTSKDDIPMIRQTPQSASALTLWK